ncbi:MAG: hypothetical protein WCG66_08490, partial [bacterium]
MKTKSQKTKFKANWFRSKKTTPIQQQLANVAYQANPVLTSSLSTANSNVASLSTGVQSSLSSIGSSLSTTNSNVASLSTGVQSSLSS